MAVRATHFGAEEFRQVSNVSRETMERLESYVLLLERWQQKTNLVGRSTLQDIWYRHILDSAQLTELVPDWTRGDWTDLGSGAGFPGLVIAILRPASAPPIRLVEANRKKALFLSEAIRHTTANAVVLNQRIEALEAETADVVSARACADLDQLLSWAYPILRQKGVCIFHKGQDVDGELTNAHKCWKMKVEVLPSQTHEHGKILLIGDIERV